MEKFFILFAGGGLGTVCRFLVSSWVLGRLGPTFPFGTLAVNVIGCLLIGLVAGLPDNGASLSPNLRFLLVIGFLGGFTTFSSYAFETFMLTTEGLPWRALLYLAGSVILGLMAVWCGAFTSRLALGLIKGT